jgi:CheY-like chemotaxis protein
MPHLDSLLSDGRFREAVETLITLAGLPADAEVSVDTIQLAVQHVKLQLQSPGAASKAMLQGATGGGLSSPTLVSNTSNRASEPVASDFPGRAEPLLVQSKAIGMPAGKIKRHALVIGELGVINYQVKTGLIRLGDEVTIVKHLDDALAAFHEQDYQYGVLDLMMPTLQDGLFAIAELRKNTLLWGIPFELFVISNPVQDKRVDKEVLANGAKSFFERTEHWQNRLFDAIEAHHVMLQRTSPIDSPQAGALSP